VAVKVPWTVPIPSQPPGSAPSVAGIAEKRTLKAPMLPAVLASCVSTPAAVRVSKPLSMPLPKA
jgi:hypothetical protein